jgi:hypothetical protein
VNRAEPFASLVAALEEARRIDEERVRAIVKEELERAGAAARAPEQATWVTPPACAEALGVGVKRIRALVRSGVVQKRARNIDPSRAKQLKLLVNRHEVEAALAASPLATPPTPTQRTGIDEATEWARGKIGNRR